MGHRLLLDITDIARIIRRVGKRAITLYTPAIYIIINEQRIFLGTVFCHVLGFVYLQVVYANSTQLVSEIIVKKYERMKIPRFSLHL